MNTKTDKESMQDASKENDAAASKAAQDKASGEAEKSHSTDGDPAKDASAAEADAAAQRTRQAQLEAEQARARANPRGDVQGTTLARDAQLRGRPAPLPIESQTDSLRVNPSLATAEGVMQQHDQVQAENDRRNEKNREGFEKIMKLDEARAEEAHARTEHFQDARAGHVPTGRQRDVNTPDILPDGTKIWR